jgi:hypothetical protein
MPIEEINAAIKALEIQLNYYENLLDQSISNNEILARTKVIYQDLKLIVDKLEKLKKMKDT